MRPSRHQRDASRTSRRPSIKRLVDAERASSKPESRLARVCVRSFEADRPVGRRDDGLSAQLDAKAREAEIVKTELQGVQTSTRRTSDLAPAPRIVAAGARQTSKAPGPAHRAHRADKGASPRPSFRSSRSRGSTRRGDAGTPRDPGQGRRLEERQIAAADCSAASISARRAPASCTIFPFTPSAA